MTEEISLLVPAYIKLLSTVKCGNEKESRQDLDNFREQVTKSIRSTKDIDLTYEQRQTKVEHLYRDNQALDEQMHMITSIIDDTLTSLEIFNSL